jgi:hypothetical protein
MTPTLDGSRVPVLGHRNSVRGLIELYEADGQALGDDRAVNFPSTTHALHEMIEAVGRVAAANDRRPGPIRIESDPMVRDFVEILPSVMTAERAFALDLAGDESLNRVVQDYVDDFLN